VFRLPCSRLSITWIVSNPFSLTKQGGLSASESLRSRKSGREAFFLFLYL
jgi:hypothetical protein